MSAFEQLDPLLQHHLVNTLGWRRLREFQEAAIEPVLAGEHCLLLAPTAGGKTEAAIFPALSRCCTAGWSGLSILYLCPLKALLNNLHQRLETYCRMLGRRCELWHGDVSQARRGRIRAEPPDVLLTTPESLEVMLISARPEGRQMLGGVKIVIIDEIHAFAGDDRGWHLLAVLERIRRLAGRELQRIGLSATVGNPEALLQWLAGHCEGARRLVQPPPEASVRPAEVQLDYVGTLRNAAIVISRLHRGEKRLVFCDSRSRVEELGGELRNLGVSVFLSHSSLSADERRTAEAAFTEAQDCVIVATSTLELGIDVGDLDRVIQIDAPRTVASFLQRLGRTGRRPGTTRNCLFLATGEESLLRAAALLALWEAGFVEPVTPPERPLHLFAQQLMALALQEGGLGVRDWRLWLGRLPCFAAEPAEVLEAIIAHLETRGYLFRDEFHHGLGETAESSFGRRHFLELVSVFTSDPIFKVLYGNQDLGSVDQLTFSRHSEEAPVILSLAGKSWQVAHLDWPRREAFVTPVEAKGKSRWLSGQEGLSWRLTRAVHEVLTSLGDSPRWTSRARNTVTKLRGEYGFLRPNADVVLIKSRQREILWFTFAGRAVNTALADFLSRRETPEAAPRDYFVRMTETTDAGRIAHLLRSTNAEKIRRSFQLSSDYLDRLKFSACLPPELAINILQNRLLSLTDLHTTIQTKQILYEEDAHGGPRASQAGEWPDAEHP